ncbi:MAG: hypothetical protein A3G41_06110 [Elusimicrobia bacterium RIFCSPLOWO2_12_FULL_59_9]|nr:MAG: hypothetical protein A3G41_06110 [Elusimicrobia bacterium RIFCSPLOWO2_12_FULL_59_9]
MSGLGPSSPAGSRLVRWLILLIGLHSCALGVFVLAAPRLMLGWLGFEQPADVFFPSQGGVFLLILGLCYLLALSEPALVKIILISKSMAVVFLVIHAAFLSAPAVIWAAAAGDGGMLIALSAALLRDRIVRPPDH